MSEDFADYAMIEDADLSFGSEPQKQTFVPAGGKQKNKNKNKKPVDDLKLANVKEPTPETGEPVKQIQVPNTSPRTTDAPSAEQPAMIQPMDALGILMDKVPDMFNDSAVVYEAVRAIVPVQPYLAMAIVACIPLLACYLDSRRQA